MAKERSAMPESKKLSVAEIKKALKTHDNLYDQFHVRLETIVQETGGIGWGFHDVLSDIYGELIAEFEEES